jgi:hypothetical protein
MEDVLKQEIDAIKIIAAADELLFSLERLVKEFGAGNVSERVEECLSDLQSNDLTDAQLTRIEQLKLICEI